MGPADLLTPVTPVGHLKVMAEALPLFRVSCPMPPASADPQPQGAGLPRNPAWDAGTGQRPVLRVSELHEGPMEVVQLQDAGEQKEARDQDAGEELRHAELLQAQVPQPGWGGKVGVSTVARPP